jgi:hypothetical protein
MAKKEVKTAVAAEAPPGTPAPETPDTEGHEEAAVHELYASLAARFEHTHNDPRGFTYITGEQCVSRLNNVLGPDGWTFEVVEHGMLEDQVWVQGRLTLLDTGAVRTQFGSQHIKRFKGGDKAGDICDIGFDLKGATTDAMKKCAAGFGVGLYLSHKEVVQTAQRAAAAQTAPQTARPARQAATARPAPTGAPAERLPITRFLNTGYEKPTDEQMVSFYEQCAKHLSGMKRKELFMLLGLDPGTKGGEKLNHLDDYLQAGNTNLRDLWKMLVRVVRSDGEERPPKLATLYAQNPPPPLDDDTAWAALQAEGEQTMETI